VGAEKGQSEVDVLDTLLANLTDETEMLSVAKLYLLSGLDKSQVERVRAVWPTIPGDRRKAIIGHLADLSESNFEVDFGSIFRIGLTDSEPEVRVGSIEGLWIEDDVALIKPLVDLMQNDGAEEVRAAAAGSLGRFVLAGELEEIPPARGEAVVDVLREVIEDITETVEVRRRAIEAIGYSSADGVFELIGDAYGDMDDRMRISAVYAMGRSADRRWADLVLGEVESSIPEMRYEAARACGELQNPGALPALKRLLDDPDDQVREASVWAMGQIGGGESRRLLVAILEDEEAEDLHEVAEEALEELEFLGGDTFDLARFDELDDDDVGEFGLDEDDGDGRGKTDTDD
jgi:HEAT repeat protein